MGECISPFCVAVSEAFGSDLIAKLLEITALPLALGFATLSVWIGFRLAAKLSNRGVGK